MYEIYERNVIMKRRLIALLVAVVVIISISLPALATFTFKADGYYYYSNDSGYWKKYWVELYGNKAGSIDGARAFLIDYNGSVLLGSARTFGFGERPRIYSGGMKALFNVNATGYISWVVQ